LIVQAAGSFPAAFLFFGHAIAPRETLQIEEA